MGSIPGFFNGITTASWMSVASMTWTLYDHALTLDDEINYVWTQRQCWGTLLFFLVRYFGLASQIGRLVADVKSYITIRDLANVGHPELQPGPINSVVLSQFALFWIVEVALQMRIYAIYARSRRLAILNVSLFLAEIAAMLSLWWESGCRTETMNVAWGPYSAKPTTSCAESHGFPWYWLPGSVFEIWLASLALYKALKRVPRETFKTDILSVLVQDSVLYFGLITVVMCVHLSSSYAEPVYFQLGIDVLSAGLTVGGSRMLLHLRRAFYRRRVSRLATNSGINFGGQERQSFWDVESL